MDPTTHATDELEDLGSYEPLGHVQLDPAWPDAEVGIWRDGPQPLGVLELPNTGGHYLMTAERVEDLIGGLLALSVALHSDGARDSRCQDG